MSDFNDKNYENLLSSNIFSISLKFLGTTLGQKTLTNDMAPSHRSWKLPKPPTIKIYCSECDFESFHDGVNLEVKYGSSELIGCQFLRFSCRNCKKYLYMGISLSNESNDNEKEKVVKKIFEYPVNFHVPKHVARFLTQADFKAYRNADSELKFGRGIGAMAYFRRIVENSWKNLLDDVISLADPIKDKKSIKILNKSKNNWQFAKSVKESNLILPKSFMVDSNNLLLLLHNATSRGIHALTDEESLEAAKDVKLMLNVLLKKIADLKEEKNTLKQSIKKLNKI